MYTSVMYVAERNEQSPNTESIDRLSLFVRLYFLSRGSRDQTARTEPHKS